MNITFWILTVAMLLVAIALLVYPLLKVRDKSALAYKESNLQINEDKIKELDLDLKEGRIDQAFYKAAREELDRELLIDIPAVTQQNASLHYTGLAKRHPAMAIMIAIFMPLLAMLLYLEIGMHSAGEQTIAAGGQAAGTEELPSVENMVLTLERRIEQSGGSLQEWTMLGRAHKHLGNYELAAKAFAVVLEQDADNAQLMLEQAEMLALNNDRLFTAQARELVLKAYALEPDNANVLWFAGVAEYQQGNYRQAIDHLLKLLPQARGEEEVVTSIISVVARSREQLIAAGEDMPELEELLGLKAQAGLLPPVPEAATTASTDELATKLSVSVDVSAEVRQKFDGSDSIFVYAQAKQGPRMPLAAQRLTLAELPATVVLDDSMAMVDGMNLSAFEQLVVSARVTKSGSAISQSGDYIGQLDVEDKHSGKLLNILIETAVP